MQRSLLFIAALIVGASPSFAAGSELTFPLDLTSAEPALDGLRYVSAHGRISDLAALESATLTAVMLPDGRLVDLDLTRIRQERMKFRYYVNGSEQTNLLDGLDLSIWKGSVRGIDGSEVMLSFSHVGTQGWIQIGSELVHAQGDWWSGDVLLVSEDALNRRGLRLDSICATPPPVRERANSALAPSSAGGPQFLTGCSLRECKVSIESDFQYYQKFNNLSAETTYTTTLWSFISDRYETQIGTILTFPYVGFYTTASDPWTTPDAPGTSSAMLNEFQAAWVGNIPNGGRVGHFMSGAALGGGVAWLNVLCDNQFNFAVAGNINSNTPFPIVVGPNNWDFMVCAHELGHNFNALHTHDYCPPLDQCPPSQYFGQCQTQQVCTNQGTLMSYCHLCSGGTSNITTFFHTQSAADMTAAAQSCLPQYTGLSGSAPTLLAPNASTPVTATIAGTPVGPVQLLWRASASQSFAAINMTSQGNGNYSASLPAFGCGDAPQFYYAFTEQTCGAITFPSGAPASHLDAAVGVQQFVFQDNFQTDQGWVPTNLGASTGDWQRGVPVNDPNWAYDPATDGDGSGMCWLTQNQVGNTDVDGGAVRLMSPQLDLSGGSVIVDYKFYLNLTVADGSDALVAEISANGTSGPWVEIARHNQNLGTSWSSNSISGSAIQALGVTLGNNMRVRFTANDGGTASIVESGLDGFRVARIVCNGIGVNYCTSTANSSGGAALASATGSNSVAANNLVLHAAPLPSSVNGLFFFGVAAMQAPFGNGVKCIASPVVRLPIGTASAGGQLDIAVNNALPPAAPHLTVGSTWNFQAWFRDPAAGGSNYNLSDGFRITFAP
jgi:hypothetical protein